MRSCILYLAFLFLPVTLAKGQAPEAIIKKVSEHWLELQNYFENPSDIWGDYTLDLTLEAFLMAGEYLEQDSLIRIVEEVFSKRNITSVDTISYRSQPFCSINFTYGNLTSDPRWHKGFIAESYRWFQEAQKSPEGALLLYHKGRYGLVIEYMQEYASRMARTASLTGDTALYSECISQFRIYEKILREKSSGLWRQGYGYCEDTTQISDGAWSRGHGWLLRGLVTSMFHMPPEWQAKLLPVLQRVNDALRKVQTENGMYHILLNLPPGESEPDVSGTGMISYYQALAVENDWLPASDFSLSILRATEAMKPFVTDKGEVKSSSKGPGPLCRKEEYRNYIPELDEKHGFQGVVYGMLAEKRITSSPSLLPVNGSLEVNGFTLDYTIEGQGQPCLVIGSSIYYPRTFSRDLRQHLQLIFVDMPWFAPARGPLPADSFSVEVINEFIEEIRLFFRLDQAVLMGHSIHGTVAMEYAKQNPDRVSALVLLGSPNIYGNETFYNIQAEALNKASTNRKDLQQENWLKLAEIRDQFSEAELIVEEYCTMGPTYWKDPEYDARWLWNGMVIHADILRFLYGGVFHDYVMFQEDDIAPTPTLVILGENDFAIPPGLWKKDLDLANLTIEVLPECGHTPQLEQAEEFDRVLGDWLNLIKQP
jgi:proline iminopeptidase